MADEHMGKIYYLNCVEGKLVRTTEEVYETPTVEEDIEEVYRSFFAKMSEEERKAYIEITKLI